MTKYVRYVTKEGDRWDQISNLHYGNPYAYEQIIDANKSAPIVEQLPAGIVLAIPVVPRSTIAASSLPPWKR